MNYLFYDYETSGRNEMYDQIFQFGAIKTDSEFNPVGDPIEFFCKPRRDVLPSPEAVKVNQIDIDELDAKGLSEFDFATRVVEVLLGDGNQCIVGYNSKSFDNKFTRFLFYRNFIDPYAWSYKNGNSCFDIFDVMSLGYSFDRLAGIVTGDEGERPLKLENLSRLNNLDHDDAHNAISDVKATIELARLIKEQCPRLVEHCLSLRSFENSKRIVTTNDKFFHSSSLNGYPNKFLSLHTSVCFHPNIKKSAIGWNLRRDPREILQLSPGEIRDHMFAKKESRSMEIGFGEFKLNNSPMVVPHVRSVRDRLADYDLCIGNFKHVRENIPVLKNLAREVFNTSVPERDPDVDLYVNDFFPQADLHANAFNAVRSNPLAVDGLQLRHIPFRRLFRRMKARNFLADLQVEERQQYAQFCSEKFACGDEVNWITKSQFDSEMTKVMNEDNLSERQKSCLAALQKYADRAMDCSSWL